MKRLLLFLLIAFTSGSALLAQTTLEGVVKDGGINDPLISATITLSKGGVFITGGTTDFDGHYLLSNLEPGTYDVEAKYIGYTTQRIEGVLVRAGAANQLNFSLTEGGVLLEGVEIVEYKVPLIEIDQGTVGATVTAESIKSLPVRDIATIAATAAGVSSQDGNGDVSMRGGRSDATEYYLDGIKMRGTPPPSSEIEQMQVITGGIEAKYGDVIGGIISLTSKGPSNKFRAGIEAETSEIVGIDGYNLVAANVSGPILKRTMDDGTEKSILGFRLSGQYKSVAERRPSYIGFNVMPEDMIRQLEANPIDTFNGTPIPAAQFLHNSDIENVKIRPNRGDKRIDLTGKLDFRFSENITASISGGYSDRAYRYTPGLRRTTGAAWSMYNWVNNPFEYRKGYRGSINFTHKLGSQSGNDEDAGALKNFYYTIQAGYEKVDHSSEDFRHEDKLFNYGFYGNKERVWDPIVSKLSDPSKWIGDKKELLELDGTTSWYAAQGYQENTSSSWTGGTDINPVLSKYYKENGQEVVGFRDVWSGIYSNVGQVRDYKWKQEDDIYSGNISFGFDIDKGSSNRHSIQLGFNYEERVNRFWSIKPRKLWLAASLEANAHLAGVDVNSPLADSTIFFRGQEFQVYKANYNLDETSKFIKEIRKLTGQGIGEYVNVDGLNPEDMRLDMFSATELNSYNILTYYGFDYLGNKLSKDTKFEDFFKGTDGTRRTQNVAPLNPVYMAGYIQDKFKYKDLILRMGVRVDYFDANTKVLKDPYSLYEIESADDYYARIGEAKPEIIGGDYKVYVSSAESDKLKGYRKGDTWYLPSGVIVDNASDVLGSSVFPSYIGRFDDRILNVQDKDFDINTSFKDYAPQINLMPRLSLSFPISDDAAFFAHYDVLVQRPSSNDRFGATRLTALDYYYFEDQQGRFEGAPVKNASLKPEQTIDYEVGFKKKVSETAAINVSAYYREMRNLIQRKFYNNVPSPINRYESYDNIDFGTVKGFSLTFDKRRTNNLEMKLTYTLQFARGTGSDLNSSRGLNTTGNIRNLLPLSIDERHSFNIVADYRFSGKSLGPEIFGKNIFKNSGLNMVIKTVSGRPYTKRESALARSGTGYLGSLSGSRLPWGFSIDLRVNKEFKIVTSEANNKAIYMEVFGRVQNLLNTRNVIGVYPYTGDPDDDGYLASEFGLDEVKLAGDIDKQSFLDTYAWRLSNPFNYTLPRRIYVGFNVSF